jgi:hypothetical protein
MSIKLADANVIKPMLGSTALATLDTASLVSVNIDFINGLVNVAVPIGTMDNGQFSRNQTSFPLTIVINLTTGSYTPSNSVLCQPGVLTSTQLAVWQSLVNSMRTQFEQTLVADNLIQGTQQNP